MSPKSKASILIVEDEETIRISLKHFFTKEKYWVTAVPDVGSAFEELKKNNYGVVISDIILDGPSGIDLLKKINKKYPETLVLLMTGYASLNSAIDALRLGAVDYIIKPCSNKEILTSIKKNLGNKIKKNKQLTEFNVKSIRCIPGEKPLTKKELEVFGYLFNGLKLSKIASTLEVSLPTVKFHLKNLYRKLGIKGRREIITICQSAPK